MKRLETYRAVVRNRATPTLILISLLLGGICRSRQFTSINATAYAEVAPAVMGSVTSFTSVMQQLSASVSITAAAFGLEAAHALPGGGALDAAHFPPVFVGIAVVSLISAISFLRHSQASGTTLVDRP